MVSPPKYVPFHRALKDCFLNSEQLVVIGAGEVFNKKIRPALEFLGFNSFLICDPAYQGPGKINSLKDAPAGSIVLILTTNDFHLEYALQCFEQGFNFYIEKPVVINTKESENFILGFQRQPHVRAYLGDYYFFKATPLLALLNKIKLARWTQADTIAQNGLRPEFGNIVKVEGYLHEGGDAACGNIKHRSWLAQAERGGGMLLDLMVHFTNILEALELPIIEISDCTCYSHIEKGGGFEQLLRPDKGEDMAIVNGWLKGSIPFSMSVAKYAPKHERWLRLYDNHGHTVSMIFGAQNTLEVSSPRSQKIVFNSTLTIDPYLLTMHEALSFLTKKGDGRLLYCYEQINSIKWIEQMKLKAQKVSEVRS